MRPTTKECEIRCKHLANFLALMSKLFQFMIIMTAMHITGMSCETRFEKPLLVFTMDGGGDGSNGTVSIGKPGQRLETISRSSNCNIGRMYRYATLLLGMRPADHEYKLMGLAAYSDGDYAKDAAKFLQRHFCQGPRV